MKKFISKIAATVFSAALLISSIANASAISKSDLDSLKAKYIILMDYESGKILFEKNADNKIYPASTTKVWTAFCVLEKSKDLNEVIEIKDMPEIEGSSMYLEDGEKFTVRQLLESLLVHSSNDVAYVLAKHFGDGKPEKFIDFMNSEAEKYGAKNTHFNNPHGLPDEKHYTTARDMTMLSRVAYGDSTIKEIVAMKSVTYKKNKDIKLDRTLVNSNKFLTSTDTMDYGGKNVNIKYEIVDGMKTGYTDDAGNCLVSTGEKNGMRMIAGVFFAPSGNLYHDSRTLLDYGFDSFKTVTIFDEKELGGTKKLKFATPGKIKYSSSSAFSVTATSDDEINKNEYSKKYNFDMLKLPVNKGDVIGTVNIFKGKEMISSIALIAEESSQNYWDFALSRIPFLSENKKSDDKSSSDSTSSNNESDNKKTDKGIVGKISESFNTAKKEVFNSAHGFIGILSEIKNSFSGMFNGNFSAVENSDFYKFLEEKIASTVTFMPAKYIIFGAPIIILLLIIILIISIIKDSFRNRISRKKKKNKEEPIFNDLAKDTEKHE